MADPRVFKASIGVLLLVFPVALYFNRTPLVPRFGGRIADAVVGCIGGTPRRARRIVRPAADERRGIFQTYNWTILTASLCLQAGTGFVGIDVLWLAALALPATLFGAWSARAPTTR